MLFTGKKSKKSYDRENKKPVIKASICNGEQVAGFLDLKSGAFEEVMLIQTPSDLDEFKRRCDINGEIEKIYLGKEIWSDRGTVLCHLFYLNL